MKNEQITPMHDQIIVKRTEAIEKTKGGIIIPEVAREELHHGTVVAVGPGKVNDRGIREPMSIKVGEKVYFTKNFTAEIQHDGSEHLIMNENRILLIEN